MKHPDKQNAPTAAAPQPKQRGVLLRFLCSLRFLLCLFCLLAIVVTAIVAWYPTFLAGQRAVGDIAQDFQMRLAPLVVDAITLRLTRFVGNPFFFFKAFITFRALALIFRASIFIGLFLPELKRWLRPTKIISKWDCLRWILPRGLLNTTRFTSDLYVTPTTGGLYGHYRDPAGLYTLLWTFVKVSFIINVLFTFFFFFFLKTSISSEFRDIGATTIITTKWVCKFMQPHLYALFTIKKSNTKAHVCFYRF